MSQPPPPGYSAPPVRPPKLKTSRRWLPWALGLLALVVGLVIGGSNSKTKNVDVAVPGPTTTQSATETLTETQTQTATTTPTQVVATKTVQVRVTFTPTPVGATGDGQYLVGSEIQPGTWHTPGGADCYYERDNSLGGEVGAIIANDNITGPTTIQIDPSDKAVKFNGGCAWSKTG
jgi:hypothetical protein